jgi:hypothetical protein
VAVVGHDLLGEPELERGGGFVKGSMLPTFSIP